MKHILNMIDKLSPDELSKLAAELGVDVYTKMAANALGVSEDEYKEASVREGFVFKGFSDEINKLAGGKAKVAKETVGLLGSAWSHVFPGKTVGKSLTRAHKQAKGFYGDLWASMTGGTVRGKGWSGLKGIGAKTMVATPPAAAAYFAGRGLLGGD